MVDFVDLQWWPVFNVADAAVVVGGIVLVLVSLREPEDEPAEPSRPADGVPDADALDADVPDGPDAASRDGPTPTLPGGRAWRTSPRWCPPPRPASASTGSWPWRPGAPGPRPPSWSDPVG